MISFIRIFLFLKVVSVDISINMVISRDSIVLITTRFHCTKPWQEQSPVVSEPRALLLWRVFIQVDPFELVINTSLTTRDDLRTVKLFENLLDEHHVEVTDTPVSCHPWWLSRTRIHCCKALVQGWMCLRKWRWYLWGWAHFQCTHPTSGHGGPQQ